VNWTGELSEGYENSDARVPGAHDPLMCFLHH